MTIENVANIKPVLSQIPKKEEIEQKITKAENKIKDGNKKMALALTGLAAIGAAAIGIAIGLKKCKASGVHQEIQENGQKTVEKIKGLIKGDDIPFEKNKIEKIKINGEEQAKETFAKYFGKFNGEDVIVEEKFISHKHRPYAFIRNKDTNDLITIKKLGLGGYEVPFNTKIITGEPCTHKTKEILKDGKIGIEKTYKNGKLFSTRKTVKNPDGSKRITIEWTQGKKGQEIIDIGADGTKSTVQKAKTIFDL